MDIHERIEQLEKHILVLKRRARLMSSKLSPDTKEMDTKAVEPNQNKMIANQEDK